MLSRLKKLLSRSEAPHLLVAREHKRLGDQHLSNDQWSLAAGAYQQAVMAAPDFAEAYIGLGYALSELRQYDAAEVALCRALSIRTDMEDAHFILGTIARAKNDTSAAITQFLKALEVKPDLEIAYRHLFELYTQGGQSRSARAVLEKGALVFPLSADFQINLGKLLLAEEDFVAAASCFRKALELNPEMPLALQCLGDANRGQGQHDEAIKNYRAALAQGQGGTDASVGLGLSLQALGRKSEAVICFRELVFKNPEVAVGHQLLGNALLELGDRSGALASYSEVLRLQPDSPLAHLVAALSGRAVDQSAAGYVEQLFDEYAENFDHSLVEQLRYETPVRLAEFVREHTSPVQGQWRILDLGCGTGLAGLNLCSYARELVGVDLSSKMLAKAKERNIYAQLVHSDLLTFMQSEQASSYDLVVAADVLIYVGRLDATFMQVGRILQTGGHLVFSAESLEFSEDLPPESADTDSGFRLAVTGRFLHSVAYLQICAKNAGLDIQAVKAMPIRQEHGKDVWGHLVICRRNAAKLPIQIS
uniref:tetratricopeptide repeat protein n=1 Tax=Hylemonella sp. TaxID=2066020 RepID=UPI0035AE23B7